MWFWWLLGVKIVLAVTAPFATVNSTFEDFSQGLLGSDYQLSDNVDQLKQYRCSQAITSTCSQDCSPLVPTKHLSPYSDHCGIACGDSGLITGVSPERLKTLRIVKIFCCALSLLLLVVLLVNQVADPNIKNLPFWERGILNHSSTFITISWTVILMVFFIVEMVGLNQVLCADNGNQPRIVSLGNPDAGWAPCSVSGFAFFLSELCICNYSAVFALSLWNLFYAPLKHTWKSRLNINCDLLDTICVRTRGSIAIHTASSSSPQISTTDNKIFAKLTIWKEKLHRQLSRSRHCDNPCGRCCVGCMCAPSFKWHVLVWTLNIFFFSGSIYNNMYNAYHPIGTCFPSASGKQNLLFVYDVLPMIAPTLFMAIFLPLAGTLLWQTTRAAEAAGLATQMRQLGFRLSLFYFGIVFSWSCIVAITLNAYLSTDKVADGAKERIYCAIGYGDAAKCYDIGYAASTAFSVMMFIAMPVAILSATILSFHERNIQRWTALLPCFRFCNFSRIAHEPKLPDIKPIPNVHRDKNNLSNPPAIELQIQELTEPPPSQSDGLKSTEKVVHDTSVPTEHDNKHYEKMPEITTTDNSSIQTTATPPTQQSSNKDSSPNVSN